MIWHAGRQVATVRDLGSFRKLRQEGARCIVPIDRKLVKAYIVENHPHVAVTTAGTFTWAQIFYAERDVIFE